MINTLEVKEKLDKVVRTTKIYNQIYESHSWGGNTYHCPVCGGRLETEFHHETPYPKVTVNFKEFYVVTSFRVCRDCKQKYKEVLEEVSD